MSGEPGNSGERFLDLLWEVYRYPREHPVAKELPAQTRIHYPAQ